MLTLAKNKQNDIFATAGRLAIAEGAECRMVIVDSIIRTQKGELQFDSNKGIDYFGTVFTNQRYIAVWAGQVKREIRKLDWVNDIEDFTYSFDRATGAVTWSMTVTTAYGDSVVADSTGAFLSKTGDGKMGIRWEDIIDKPTGLDNISEFIRAMKQAAMETSSLTDPSTLKDTKTVVNKIRDGIANA